MKDANVESFCFPNALCGSTRAEKIKVEGLHSHGNKREHYKRKNTCEGKDHC